MKLKGNNSGGRLGSDREIQFLKQFFNLATRGLSIIFIFLPFFIQLPFPLLTSLFF